jgi:glycosyltransferase involved in cell wall biosynthesis
LAYHVLLGRSRELETQAAYAAAGAKPGSVIHELSRCLRAVIHEPGAAPVKLRDRLRALEAFKPENWALGRQLAGELDREDVVCCLGEAALVPLLHALRARKEPPRVALLENGGEDRLESGPTHAQHRAAWIGRAIADAARRNASSSAQPVAAAYSVLHLDDYVDTHFFTPGPPSWGRTRPLVASVGWEQGDFRTLAHAVGDLDVDVRIAGAPLHGTHPEEGWPANFAWRRYEWKELVQLYRDASVVAISLLETDEKAGISTLLEAWSCRRPVVVTRTAHLAAFLAHEGVAKVVEPGDSVALRAAILELLQDRAAAEIQAERCYHVVRSVYSAERQLERIIAELERLAPAAQA